MIISKTGWRLAQCPTVISWKKQNLNPRLCGSRNETFSLNLCLVLTEWLLAPAAGVWCQAGLGFCRRCPHPEDLERTAAEFRLRACRWLLSMNLLVFPHCCISYICFPMARPSLPPPPLPHKEPRRCTVGNLVPSLHVLVLMSSAFEINWENTPGQKRKKGKKQGLGGGIKGE